jgi:hypothetical protein
VGAREAALCLPVRTAHVLSGMISTSNPGEPLLASESESERAHSLVRTLGTRVYKKRPLGYGDMGLLLVFPQTVPNNTLPILHSQAKGSEQWDPLFERPVN